MSLKLLDWISELIEKIDAKVHIKNKKNGKDNIVCKLWFKKVKL